MSPIKVLFMVCCSSWLVAAEYGHFEPSYGPHYDPHIAEPIHHVEQLPYDDHGHHEIVDHHSDHHGDHHHEEHHEAKPYSYGYAVKDPHHGTDFDQHESSDGHNVKGQYRVKLPDGRTQIVTYHADWKNGFHADVQYEGEAHYPDPKDYGHGSSSYGHGAGSSYGGDFGGYSYPEHGSYSSEGY